MVTTLERNLWLTTPMLRGDDILLLQQRLTTLGAKLDQDGLYGRGTRSAVEAFQRARDLQVDGVVGIATWTAVMPAGPGGVQAIVRAPSQVTDVLTPEALAALQVPHRHFKDGVAWALGRDGITAAGGSPSLIPSDLERALVAQVFAAFAQPLTTVLNRIQVPVELLVACICTESSGKPDAWRREPGCDLGNPERTPSRVSWGLTQTLLSTAREAMRQPDLPLKDLLVPEISIRAGAAFMWNQSRRTGFDPPLVAAAYNAGSLRHNAGAANHWKLLQYPIGTAAHVDRFCRYFNAAIQNDATLPAGLPRFRGMFGGGGGGAPGRAPAPTTGPKAAPAPTAVARTAVAAPGPDLRKGDNDQTRRWGGVIGGRAGTPVADLQRALTAVGTYEGTVDGDFGNLTERAIRRFQWFVGNSRFRLRLAREGDAAAGTIEEYAAVPDIRVNGQYDAATGTELGRWVEAGRCTTTPLVRLKTAGLARTRRADTFRTLAYPGAADDEILASAAFVGGLEALDTAAAQVGVKLLLNQTFRIADAPVSGAVVPPAARSQHLIGHAVDLNIVVDDAVVTAAMLGSGHAPQPARNFVAEAKRRKLRWGGDFTPTDPPHFDLQVPSDSEAYDFQFFFCQHLFGRRHPIRSA